MNNLYRPSLKKTIEYCNIEDKIYFFQRPGVAIELKDPRSFISTVVKLLDGTKTVHEIEQILLSSFLQESQYLHKLLAVLDNEKLLEDASNISSLTDYEQIRWSRNIEFFGAYCISSDNKYSYQEKLKSTKVTVFGLGGVGSNVLYNLVAMGVYDIQAVDFDMVELSNFNRQIIYDESDIGRFKTDAAKDRVSKFAPHSNIAFIKKQISDFHEIEELISGRDIIIVSMDHPRDKIIDWFNLACVNQCIPFICGSLDSQLVTYYTIVPGVSGCVECWKTSTEKFKLVYKDIIQHKNFVAANSPNVAIMPLISLVSGFVTSEFLKIATQIGIPHSVGKLYAYDFLSSQMIIQESWQKNEDCEICSNNRFHAAN